MKLIFASERLLEKKCFALLKSVLAEWNCSSNNLLLFFGDESISARIVLPKYLSEQPKIESVNYLMIHLCYFHCCFAVTM